MKTTSAGPNPGENRGAGSIHEVTDEHGEELIAAGFAEAAEPELVAEPEEETAPPKKKKGKKAEKDAEEEDEPGDDEQEPPAA
ncbi:MAG TPA: hypothetical protein VNN08_02920 [Thermoanaerobaculia bacterium]|nr:hypothetical protein [Thermoanaerobaculia bacterium]